MPKIEYVPHKFYGAQRQLVDAANRVIEDYVAQGYVLTLRQLFYRLVTMNTIPNTQRDYKRLGALMTAARLAGETDWEAMEDITRNLRQVRNWKNPKDAVLWLADQYHTDMWANQPYRVEVWIEKDALSGVFSLACARLDVPFFSCRGYSSASEMWRAAMRLQRHKHNGQEPIIFHFGDHDPSGIDMTRDIDDRLVTFETVLEMDRRALNIDQVKKFKLPPNPARQTDARYRAYKAKFGTKSWELDALEPSILAGMVERAVLEYRDEKLWKIAARRENCEQKKIRKLAMTVL